ncbi:MAG: hypothetical protein NC037_00485 [Bacteroides sp.]|nr:hypothetical protein [Bacillota bacterium]MCM1393587.1 hypothetical protein [[Eubacterium] siraeum]MCM1454994.1 hypothetical protein [Bacteroides sp.]
MEFDENKKLDVEISENEFVENRVNEKRSRKKRAFDILDLAIVPVVIGVFVSLGFLFANIFKATSAIDAVSSLAALIANV